MLKGHCLVEVEPKLDHSIHKETIMAEAEIVVDVEASHLSESMQGKLNTLWGQPNEVENFTIFRIPHNIRQSRKNFFEPSVISIGPFHHGKPSLRAMEEKKWRFLRDFLSRGDHISVDLCISEMKLLEERTRKCYSETVDLDSNSFVQMMLLDGCFVLEYFLKRKEEWFNDSILEVGWNFMFIDNDLLLLENQIPFFVVEKLCEIGLKQEDRKNFVYDLIRILESGPTNHSLIPIPPAQIHHLVHLYHHCSVPHPRVVLSSKSFHLTRMLNPKRIKDLLLGFLSWVLARIFSRSTFCTSVASQNSTEDMWSSVIPCATELHDAGVKFRQKNNPQHMLDISFDNGVLEIPRQIIFDSTKPFLSNLIAFEQCKFGKMHVHLAAFARLLDLLVNTQKDVMILQQCGIFENWLSSEEELADFINQLGQGAVVENDHSLAELFTEVNKYSQSSWNKQRAKFVRDYFSSPWAAISLGAAVILLALTCVQSFFAAYAYYVPPRA